MSSERLREEIRSVLEKVNSSNTPVYIWARRLLDGVSAALAQPDEEPLDLGEPDQLPRFRSTDQCPDCAEMTKQRDHYRAKIERLERDVDALMKHFSKSKIGLWHQNWSIGVPKALGDILDRLTAETQK